MRIILILLISLSLQACGISRMFSGETSKTVVVDSNGQVVTNRFGQAVYNTTTKSKSAGIYEGAARMIEALPDETNVKSAPCGGLSFEQLAQLAPSAQSAFGNCLAAAEANKPFQIMGDALAMALTKYQSSAHAIAAEATNAVRAIQQGSVEKWNAIGNFGKFSIGVTQARKAVQSSNESIRDVGIAGAENAGDIATTVNVSADSNDGGNGIGGAGAGGMGSGIGGAGTGGNGSGTNTVNVFAGRGNDNTLVETSDQSRALVNTTASQQLDASANGAVNDRSNIDQQPVIDSQTDSILENTPSNGSDNSVF